MVWDSTYPPTHYQKIALNYNSTWLFQEQETVSYQMKVSLWVQSIYSFSHNLGEKKLQQKATLEMQHCAQGSYTPLCIVQSDSLVPPHKFQTLQGGKFDSSDRYASIELDHFCSFAVYLAWFFHQNLSTRATLFYINTTLISQLAVSISSCTFTLIWMLSLGSVVICCYSYLTSLSL